MYHAIVYDHFIKNKSFFKKYPIVSQKADQALIAHVVHITDQHAFIKDLQDAMITDIPYCCPVYSDYGCVTMVFKNLVCTIDPNYKNIWEDATDYISEVTHTPVCHNYCYPKKISDEPLWLHTNNEIEELAEKLKSSPAFTAQKG